MSKNVQINRKFANNTQLDNMPVKRGNLSMTYDKIQIVIVLAYEKSKNINFDDNNNNKRKQRRRQQRHKKTNSNIEKFHLEYV